ncbi:MAG: hypothetical protein IKU29_00840, partial [Parabacteroides sp.]|nr:hypothetical protein [Parabacteroides sp.]
MVLTLLLGTDWVANRDMLLHLLSQDVVMSIGFALSGGVLQKQFMPLSTDAKVKFLQDAFKDVNLSHDDALKILKTMDDISAGKLSADDYKKQLLPSDEQMNIITKPNEELPMIDYGQRTPSELARLKELYRESLSQEELDILVKLPKDEEYAISYLMHGKGLSFENSRYHYALPEEVKAKADIVLQYIPLENIKNYKEFITKIVDFTEEEIYSIADLVYWSKGEADADVCLEIANVCREIPDKLQQLKNISKLYYKNETIFTAEDLLKIAKSEADFSSVIKFFEVRKSFYAQEAFNLDNVEFKESSELVDFACLINEYNILPLSELCYYKSQKKLDLDFLKDVAEVIKDEGARDEITLAERILGIPYDSLKSFIADYKENPTMAVALVKVRCYQPGISDGMMTFKDEFSTHYVSKCFDSWTHQDIVATYHKEFMDNLEKFPEETQASLKELYLNPNYNQIGMVAMSRLE